jgi:hypothetical protein
MAVLVERLADCRHAAVRRGVQRTAPQANSPPRNHTLRTVTERSRRPTPPHEPPSSTTSHTNMKKRLKELIRTYIPAGELVGG